MNDKWLAMGIDAMRLWGDEAKARGILREYVSHHAEDERGWYWLSQVADEPTEEATCLRQLLKFKARPTSVQTQPAQSPMSRTVSQPQPIGTRSAEALP